MGVSFEAEAFVGYPELRGNAPFPVERSFLKSLTMEWINGTQSEAGLLSFRPVEAIDTGSIEVDYCLGKMFDLEDAPAAFTARPRSRPRRREGRHRHARIRRVMHVSPLSEFLRSVRKPIAAGPATVRSSSK
jgi:hypothetical protein